MNLPEKFTITEDHLKLAKRSHFHHDTSWFQYGAPAVGQKRPYGNSDVVGDISEILGWDVTTREDDGDYPVWAKTKALAVHEQMATVFQIAACTLKFEVGEYKMLERFKVTSWEKVG
jgi:hypothetical protein